MRELYCRFTFYSSKPSFFVFLKFAIAGVLSAVIELVLLIVLVEKAKVNYLISNSIAFIITNMVNYLLSRFWVFGKSDKIISVEATLFFIVASMGLLINQIIMWYLTGTQNLDYRYSKMVAIVVVVAWNFTGRKFFVFTSLLKNKHA